MNMRQMTDCKVFKITVIGFLFLIAYCFLYHSASLFSYLIHLYFCSLYFMPFETYLIFHIKVKLLIMCMSSPLYFKLIETLFKE